MACNKTTTCGHTHHNHSYHTNCHGKHRSRDPKHFSTTSIDSLIEFDIGQYKNFDVHLNHNNTIFKLKNGKTGRKGHIIFQNTTAANLCLKDAQVCGSTDIATFGGMFPIKLVPEQILFVEYYFSSLSLILRLRSSCMAVELLIQTLVIDGTNAAISTFQKDVAANVSFVVSDFTYTVNGNTYTASDVVLQNGKLKIVADGNDTNNWSVTAVVVTYNPTPQSDCASLDCSLVSDWLKSFSKEVAAA